MAITVSAIDHIVLTVRDIERTLNFYEAALGMRRVEFKPGRFALTFGYQKINLHEVGDVVDQNVRHATPGSADLCLLTNTPLSEAMQHLRSHGINIVQGPLRATGARSVLASIYFYDPDENLIEVSNEGTPFEERPPINEYTSMNSPLIPMQSRPLTRNPGTRRNWPRCLESICAFESCVTRRQSSIGMLKDRSASSFCPVKCCWIPSMEA
jgi:catechol 2,3-dioxygenase-like lactoylglutathione lyase family enzyme